MKKILLLILVIPFLNLSEIVGQDFSEQTIFEEALHHGRSGKHVVKFDANLDGLPDLLVAGGTGNNKVSLFLNQQGELLDSARVLTYLEGIIYSGAVDLDNDDDDDVLLGLTDQIYALENDGTGQFLNPVLLLDNILAKEFDFGDLNNDDLPDLIWGFNDISWSENQGSFTFSASALLASNFSPGSNNQKNLVKLEVKDIDNDGDLDMFSIDGSGQFGDGVILHENDGSNNFSQDPIMSSFFKNTVKLGDFNNDKNLDLAYFAVGSSAVTVLLNDGNNSFSFSDPITFGATSNPGIEVIDINQDGFDDIIVDGGLANSSIIYVNDQNDGFTETVSLVGLTGNIEAFVDDFDNDSDLDIVTSSSFDGDIILHRQNTDGSFASDYYIGYTQKSIVRLQYLDYDRDGFKDLVTTDSRNGILKIIISYNDGNGNYNRNHEVIFDRTDSNTSNDAIIEDFDDNGTWDLVYAWHESIRLISNIEDPENSVTNTLSNVQFEGFGGSFKLFKLGDIDNDGDLDIFANTSKSSPLAQGARWFENQGNLSFAEHVLPNIQFKYFSLGDFNNDQFLDLAFTETLSMSIQDLHLYTYDDQMGDFVFDNTVEGIDNFSNEMLLADPDGDGDLDIVYGTGAIHWVENTDGVGSLSDQQTLIANADASSGTIKAGDFNLDGMKDIVFNTSVNSSDLNLAIALNGGNGQFNVVHFDNILQSQFEGLSNYTDILVDDLDDDGKDDIVATFSTNPTVPLWFKNTYEEPIDLREQDSLALVAIYDATDGANWTNNTNWKSGNLDTWEGITVENDRVTILGLLGGLNGSLPADIGNLSALRELGVLSSPNLTGAIPSEIGNLVELEVLVIEETGMEGSIPASLGSLSNLTELSLKNNPSISGAIPTEINQLSNLVQLFLENNALSGEIPDLSSLSNLEELYLQGNSLNGTIPTSLANISTLIVLFLNDNNFEGQLPEAVTNLTNLVVFNIENNPLLCESTSQPYTTWTSGLGDYLNSNTCSGYECTNPITASPGTITAPQSPYWYTYTTGAEPELLTISTRGSGVDTDFDVYDACDGEIIAENDDIDAVNEIFQSEATFVVEANTTIYIQWLDTWEPTGFDWTLTTEEVPSVLFSNVAAYGVDGGTTVVRWSDIINDPATTYTVERSVGTNDNFTTLSQAVVKQAQFPGPVIETRLDWYLFDESATAGTTYFYRVVGTDAENNTIISDEISITVEDFGFNLSKGLFDQTYPNSLKGLAWGDYDGDGDEDLFAGQFIDATNETLLLQNNGDGTFTNQLTEAGLPFQVGNENVRGAAWGDFNNDGLLDLISGNIEATNGVDPYLSIFLNKGDETFEEVRINDNLYTWPIGLADFNNDNLLDFVTSTQEVEGQPGELAVYLSDVQNFLAGQKNHYSLVSAPLNTVSPWTIITGDIEGDGDMDIFVPTTGENEDQMFINDGAGNFTEQEIPGLTDIAANHRGAQFVDIDNDGDEDIYLSSKESDQFYINDGAGNFTATDLGLNPGGRRRSAALQDFDNDGDLDAIVAEGDPSYWENVGGTFIQVSEFGWEVNGFSFHSGASAADYNNDGLMDFVVAGLDALKLYENNGTLSGNDNYLKVKLNSRRVNYAALGAKIVVSGTGSGTMTRTLKGQTTAESHNSLIKHFGLGAATTADVTVYWPDGRVSNFTDVAANQTFEVNDVEDIHLDSLALIDFYIETGGPNWTNNTNWLTGPVNTWFGVTVEDGRVTRLDFTDDGTEAFEGNGLTGTIPVALAELSALQELRLDANAFSGTIPSDLGTMQNLTVLSLSYNNLTGEIPAALGNLSNIIELNLTRNALTGSIPSELGQLSTLEGLYLIGNELTGSIPIELGSLSSLRILRLWENQLSGEIPTELGNLANLTNLSIRDNQFTGSIPASLGSIQGLEIISISNNQLSGEIPPELTNLNMLGILRVNDNNLTGTIPEGIIGLTNLTDFQIQNNTGLCEPTSQQYLDWVTGLNTYDNTNTCQGSDCSNALVASPGTMSAPQSPYWYTYTTGAEPELLTISTRGSGVDTDFDVYDACDGEIIAENDDIDAVNEIFQSEATFVVEANTTIYIQWLDTWEPTGFDWTLTTEEVPSVLFSNVAAYGVDGGTTVVRWSDIINDPATTYTVERSVGTNDNFTTLSQTVVKQAQFPGPVIETRLDWYLFDESATAGTTYFYRVVGTDAENNTIISDEISITVEDFGFNLSKGLFDQTYPNSLKGLAWGDYDGDGDEDLFAGQFIDATNETLLLQNNGDGTFTNKLTEAGLPFQVGNENVRGAAWGDFNNDGLLDLISGNIEDNGVDPYLSIFLNKGDETFEEVRINDNLYTWPIGLADFNNDNLLDFVTSTQEVEGQPGELAVYLSDVQNFLAGQKNHYSLVSAPLNTVSPWTIITGDIEGDGDMDIFVPTTGENEDQMFINDGAGNFTEQEIPGLTDIAANHRGAQFVDIDNDGDEDIYLSSKESDQFYINDGAGNFTATDLGLNPGGGVRSAALKDFDNDGDLDAIVAEGDPSYWANVGGTFSQVSEFGWEVNGSSFHSGASAADYNNDGLMDFVIAGLDALKLYENNGTFSGNDNYLKVKLNSRRVNYSGIGAKISVTGTGSGTMTRTLRGQSTAESHNSLIKHFGLGAATTADVTVYWPDGRVSNFTDVAANQTFEVNDFEDIHLDSLALIDFYVQTGGPNWTNNTNWLTGPVDTWFGVTVEDGRVTRLDFGDDGTEINEGNNLSGNIPLALVELDELTFLNLYDNNLEGSIPGELGQLDNLEQLLLGGNQLSGSIPAGLSQLSGIVQLSLSNNNLTGSIPSEFGQLSTLQFFDAFGNNLEGELPAELANLSALQVFQVYANQLSGIVPESYTTLTNLISFSIGDNPDLCEPTTQAYTDWTTTIDGYENSNTCSATCEDSEVIAAGMHTAPRAPYWYNYTASNLENVVISSRGSTVDTNLEVYDACDGNLIAFNDDINTDATIWQSEVQLVLQPSQTIYIHWTPEWEATGFDWSLEVSPHTPVNQADSLALVALYNATDGPNWNVNTNWLQPDQFVASWQGVTTDNGRVVSINLQDDGTSSFEGNGLTGSLPDEIGDLTALVEFNLSSNALNGTIPTTIGGMVALEVLNLSFNPISGNIPVDIGSLTALRELWMRGTQLTGEIPQTFSNLTSLSIINLADNDLNGTLPEDIVNLTNVNSLQIQGNPGLCEPETQAYLDWTAGLDTYNNEGTCQVDAEFLAYEVPGQLEDAVIDYDNLTLTISLGCLEDYNLVPTFSLPEGAIASINNQEQTSGTSAVDFSNPVVYDVTAGSGTIESWTIIVNLPDAVETFEIDIVDNTSCGESNGSLLLNSFTVAGNVITDFSGYEIAWSNDNFNSILGAAVELTNLSAGEYQLKLSNTVTGCENETTLTIADLTEAPVFSFVTSDNTVCSGTGNGSVTIDNPDTDNFAYTYFEGTIENIGNQVGSGEVATELEAGSYVVEVEDLNTGCTALEVFEIIESTPAIVVDASTSAQTNCDTPNGEISIISISINGEAIALPDTRFDLVWSDLGSGNERTGLEAGTYNVTIEDTQTGCTYEESFVVTEQTLTGTIQVASSSNVTSCITNNGAVAVTVDGETAGFEFSWFTGGGVDGTAFSTSNSISGLSAGTYTVKVNAQGSDCFSTRTISIVDATPDLSVNLEATENTNCENPNGTARVASLVIDGVTITNLTGYTVSWGTSFALDNNLPNTQEITGLAPDRYFVQVTDNTSGCTSVTSSIEVEETLTLPEFSINTTNNTLCSEVGDGSATLSGVIEGQSIAWFIGESETAIEGETNATLDNLAAGTYRAEVTTPATGCSTTQTFTITDAPANISVTASATNNTSCTAANGSVSVESIEVNGESVDIAGFTIEWSDTEDFSIALESTENLSAGIYFVKATNNSTECVSATTSVNIEDQLPQIGINLEERLLDRPGPDATGSLVISITGTTNYSINWYAGANAEGNTLGSTEALADQQAGLYTIQVTDTESGCSVSESFTIVEDTKLLQEISFSLPDVLFQDQLPFTMEATSDQGLPITYEIISGEGTIDAAVLTDASPGILTIRASNPGNETYLSAQAEATVEIKGNYDLSGIIAPLSGGEVINANVRAFVLEGNTLTPVAEVAVDANNDFLFAGLRENVYYIQVNVRGTTSDVAYDTYFEESLFSNTATGIDLQSDFNFTMSLVERPTNTPAGNGRIIGTVVGNNQGNRIVTGRTLDGEPLPDVNVYLLDAATGAIVAQATTDENGAFEMTGIASGEYTFSIDAVGAELADLSTAISFDETAGDLVISAAITEDGLAVETEISEVTNVEEISSTIKLYPNPAHEFIIIESPVYKLRQIRLINLSGQLLQTFVPNFSGQYQVNEVKPGLYLLQLETVDNDVVTLKLRIE